VTVREILEQRKKWRIRRIEDLGKMGIRLKKASKYLVF
jgi:predicted DNA-binding helix-hairpin-helix protein